MNQQLDLIDLYALIGEKEVQIMLRNKEIMQLKAELEKIQSDKEVKESES